MSDKQVTDAELLAEIKRLYAPVSAAIHNYDLDDLPDNNEEAIKKVRVAIAALLIDGADPKQVAELTIVAGWHGILIGSEESLESLDNEK